MTSRDSDTDRTEDRRLVILRLLSEAPQYRANESLLRMQLGTWSHAVPKRTLRTDLAWLAERELLTIDEIGGVALATLSEDGLDAANGVLCIEGVRRPSPR